MIDSLVNDFGLLTLEVQQLGCRGDFQEEHTFRTRKRPWET
ncbi:hypothetical protein ABZ912_51115 [Nonomuraea angiospora]